MNMAFKVVFLAHAPDAEPEKHKCLIETSKYKLFVRVVQNQAQAVEVCQNLVEEEGIRAILLCPGFTHKNIAELAEAVGQNVGIFVARGDTPSNRVVAEVMEREGWFSEKGKE
jgi:biotin synthase-related radical SAM superfamily protein